MNKIIAKRIKFIEKNDFGSQTNAHLLVPGQEYTVKEVIVGNYMTLIEINEIEGEFNSLWFKGTEDLKDTGKIDFSRTIGR